MIDPQPGDIVWNRGITRTMTALVISRNDSDASLVLYEVYLLDLGYYTWYGSKMLNNGSWEIAA